MACATSSLPVPLSPVMSTIASVGAIFTMRAEHVADRLRAPDDVLELVALLELAREEPAPAPCSLRLSSALPTFTSSSCSVNGFWM